MEYIKLGNSDLNVSRICLGCMGFGDANKGMHKWTLDLNSSKEIIEHAIDVGIIFLIQLWLTKVGQVKNI